MKTKRILCAVLAVLMLAGCASSFAGCKKKPVAVKGIVENAYKVTTLEKPEDMNYTRHFFRSGDRIVLSFNYYNEETYESEMRTYSMALDGTDLRPEEIPALQNEEVSEDGAYSYVQQVMPAEDGTYWKTVYWSKWDSETGESEEEYYLRHVTAENEELFSIAGTDIWGPPSDDPEEYVYHYMEYLTVVEDGLLFADNRILYYLSKDGQLKGKLSLDDLGGDGYIQRIFSADGKVLLLYSDYSSGTQKVTLFPVELQSFTLGAPHELDPATFRNVWNYFPGDGFSFYYNDDEALYGYDMATGTSTLLMNFLNSDVTSNAVNNVIILSKDCFISNGYDNATGGYQLMKLERLPDDQQIPKYIMTVASMNAWSVQNEVIRFNRQSDEYRFVMKIYSPEDYYVDTTKEYNYEELQQQALTALNNDIIAGNVPDVLVVDPAMQMDSYISKGLFADLYTLLDNDGRFKREDFLTNVLDAYAVNGKLYELAPSFNVRTLVGKKSMIGDRTGWTMKEFVEWSKTIPEGAKVFYELTRDQLLDLFLTYAYEEFVDPDTGECSFDSEDFKLILEYVKDMPTKSFWEQMNDEYDPSIYEEYENRFREDKAMLEQAYINYFNSLVEMMSYTFYTEEDLVMVGLPSMDRSGAVIYASPTYAVSAQSPVIDGAWAFVSYFLTEEYQDSKDYEFPIRLSSLEKMAAKAVEDAEAQRKRDEERENAQDDFIDDDMVVMPAVPMPAASAETTAVVETEAVVAAETAAAETTPAVETEEAETEAVDLDGDGVIDGEEDAEKPVAPPMIGMPNPVQRFPRIYLDREMADEMIAFLKTVNHVYRSNAKVNNIIKEEAGAYFAGDKSLEETVKLIQNRVSIMVAEGR